jgi:hypothetical protein
MKWINFKEEKVTPKENSWVIILSSLKPSPKYEVCHYKNNEWYLPSYDDTCVDKFIVKWAYIEE